MCWSGEASAVLATVGLGTTAYLVHKKESPKLYLPLGYFALMELLQAFTYTVINRCDDPLNRILTLLGYLHIVFQPFFGNMISLYFIPADISRRIKPTVRICCLLGAIAMSAKLFQSPTLGTCHLKFEPLCSSILCSTSGNWHIAWNLPFNGLPMAITIYMLVGFALPILYGSWKIQTWHLFFGPGLAILMNTQNNEWPAVWCLLSISLIMTSVKTPLRATLHVKSWPLWRILRTEGLRPFGTNAIS